MTIAEESQSGSYSRWPFLDVVNVNQRLVIERESSSEMAL